MKKIKPIFLLGILSIAISLLLGCSIEVPDGDDGIDVDFTTFSVTMAQAEFFHVISNSSEYYGQVMRIRGAYFSFYFPPTGLHYHHVTVIPGDECCRMGFEFKVSGEEKSYPEDFPAQGTIIEITGVLSIYEEFGSHFLFLDTDEIVIVN